VRLPERMHRFFELYGWANRTSWSIIRRLESGFHRRRCCRPCRRTRHTKRRATEHDRRGRRHHAVSDRRALVSLTTERDAANLEARFCCSDDRREFSILAFVCSTVGSIRQPRRVLGGRDQSRQSARWNVQGNRGTHPNRRGTFGGTTSTETAVGVE